MSWWVDLSWQAAQEPWEETDQWRGRSVEGSAAWLVNARKGMDHCIRETIKEVRTLEAQVKKMEADGQAAAGRSMAPQMQEAVAYLQERQANLDWQGLRTVVLDTLGIWVWDPKNRKNRHKQNVVLSKEARELNYEKIQQYSEDRRALMQRHAHHLQCEYVELMEEHARHCERALDQLAKAASATPSRAAASSYAQPLDVPPSPFERLTPNRKPPTPGRPSAPREPWELPDNGGRREEARGGRTPSKPPTPPPLPPSPWRERARRGRSPKRREPEEEEEPKTKDPEIRPWTRKRQGEKDRAPAAKARQEEPRRHLETGPLPWRDSGAASAKKPFPGYCVLEVHEYIEGSELANDWTLDENRGKEFALRELRNELIKDKLQKNQKVVYRSSGWSCYPYIWSNDLCYYAPVHKQFFAEKTCCYWSLVYWDDHKQNWYQLDRGHVVFCAVEPGNRFFAHPIKHIEWTYPGESHIMQPRYTIANLAGHENGHSSTNMIWGVLYQVNDKPFDRVKFKK